mmetsp:Transcript_3744/g.23562  ORF Transcript_3744/g.23562 Transcript_3744/m.23562 type:complete len:85 (+) Transcript_3744:110-364(+)
MRGKKKGGWLCRKDANHWVTAQQSFNTKCALSLVGPGETFGSPVLGYFKGSTKREQSAQSTKALKPISRPVQALAILPPVLLWG